MRFRGYDSFVLSTSRVYLPFYKLFFKSETIQSLGLDSDFEPLRRVRSERAQNLNCRFRQLDLSFNLDTLQIVGQC